MTHPLSPLPLALLCAFPLAQATEETATLPTVSVTAKGYAADELEIPIATTTLDRDALLRKQPQNPGEALRGEPGISLTSDGVHGQNPVIRGLKRESVVLLVDGVRLNSAQPNGAIAALMSLGLAERLEVFKGPASVLYGTGALGGAINVRLPQARFDAPLSFEASASVDSASQGLRSTGLLRTSSGDHALMLGGTLARIDDYKAPAGTVTLTGYDSDALIAQYRFRIDRTQQLHASVQQQTDKDVWYPGSKKPHAHTTAIGNTVVHSPKQQRQLMALSYERQGSGEQPVNMNLRVYRQEVDRAIESYSDKLKRNIGETDVSFSTHGVDAKADWLLSEHHLLSFGLNAWRMQASPERHLASPTPWSPLVRNVPFSDAELQSLGFFLQDDMRLGKLNVLAALRHDTVEGDATSMNNGLITTGLQRKDRATGGSLGLIYEATPLLRPFANLSRGFRAGEMRERYETSPRGDGYLYVGNPQIRPEFATQFELGLKGASGALTYTASVFHTRITDYITGQVTGATQQGLPVKQTVNLGRVVIQGLEASTRWQFLPGQWFSAGYSRIRGDNKDLNEPQFQMPADELNLSWEGRVAPAWTADANARLVARQARVATTFARGTENATAGFGTLNVGTTWRYAPQHSLRLAVRNLTHKAHHEHLTEGISGQEIQAPGRSLQVTWQGAF